MWTADSKNRNTKDVADAAAARGHAPRPRRDAACRQQAASRLLVCLVCAVGAQLARLELAVFVAKPDATRAARHRARHGRRHTCVIFTTIITAGRRQGHTGTRTHAQSPMRGRRRVHTRISIGSKNHRAHARARAYPKTFFFGNAPHPSQHTLPDTRLVECGLIACILDTHVHVRMDMQLHTHVCVCVCACVRSRVRVCGCAY